MSKIHIFWIGSAIPTQVQSNINKWEEHYPGKVVSWTDENLSEYSGIFSRLGVRHIPEAMKVDLLRVLVIKKFGGWYVDADSTPGEKFLFEASSLVFFTENPSSFLNGVFFSPSAHPFLDYWIDEIVSGIKIAALERDNEINVARLSGPGALNRALVGYLFEDISRLDSIKKIPSGIELAPGHMTSKQTMNSYIFHQGFVSWHKSHSKSTAIVKLREKTYYRWSNWGKLNFFRELIRIALDSPRVLIENFTSIRFYTFLGRCTPLDITEYRDLHTSYEESKESLKRASQNITCAEIRYAAKVIEPGVEFFWTTHPFIQKNRFFRRNWVSNVPIMTETRVRIGS